MVANVIGGSKKVNVRANIRLNKVAEPFSNGSLISTIGQCVKGND
jgi:hypothetical protein